MEKGIFTSIEDERQLRCRGCRYIERFVKYLQLSHKQALLATGFFYLQVYYAYHAVDVEDLGLVCLSCTMLACKIGESHKKMRELIRVYGMEIYGADTWHPPEHEVQRIREQVLSFGR